MAFLQGALWLFCITLDGFGHVRATAGERVLEEINDIASEENNYE